MKVRVLQSHKTTLNQQIMKTKAFLFLLIGFLSLVFAVAFSILTVMQPQIVLAIIYAFFATILGAFGALMLFCALIAFGTKENPTGISNELRDDNDWPV